MMIKNVFLAWIACCSLLLEGGEDKSFDLTLYNQVSWLSIKLDDDRAHPRAKVSGYISFDGSGDYPTVTLWEDADKMKDRRVEYSLQVESESFMKLVNAKFGSGTNNWKVLQGLYVEVCGALECDKDATWAFGVAAISEVRKISIKNNGRILMSLEKEK